MEIRLKDLGKRYHKEWVFRRLSQTLESRKSYAIVGPNGSGKSTLLKIIGNFIEPSEGAVEYYDGKDSVPLEEGLLNITFCAPYLNLISELTLQEHLDFHFQLRQPQLEIPEILERTQLTLSKDQPVAEFSSGMMQRVRLALAFYTEATILLLDEPTANLDEKGIRWYQEEIQTLSGQRTIIIASNQRYEYEITKNLIEITNFKSSLK